MAAFRARAKSRSMLFTAYSAEGDEVLAIKIARRLRMTYQGRTGADTKRRLKFGFDLADGK